MLRSEVLHAPTIAKRLKLNRATVQDRVKRLDELRATFKVLEETKRGPKVGKYSYFYLPGYSPELNPAELLNNDLKIALHKGEPARCKRKLKTKVRKHMMKRELLRYRK